MKKIAIVSSTRADYGLLYPIIKKFRLQEDEKFKLELIITGTHLSSSYGMTIKEIESDNIRIDHIVDCSTISESHHDIACNISETISKFTALITGENYQAILVLGDRYEILGVAIAATICRLPIFHIGGGDTTEGAIDESIRHSISKMSFIHFTTNEISRKRVIQLGEDSKNVYNVGSTGIDNMLGSDLMDKQSSLRSIGLNDCDYALCTYHPETLSNIDCKQQIKQFIEGLSSISMEFIITKSNSDLGGNKINEYLDNITEKFPNIHVFSSLGRIRYLSLMKHASCIIGNSSSGIIEAPFYNVPTVNIGNRQKGRLYSKTIINSENDADSIRQSIISALDMKNNNIPAYIDSPYGDGNSSSKIVSLSMLAIAQEINLMKKFNDIDVCLPN